MSSTSNRHRTLRKQTTDLSGTDYAVNSSLEQILTAEAGTAYRKPWHRLERGLRLNRLRAFTEQLASTRSLKSGEQAALLALLTKSLDKKFLNSKTAVLYDPEKEEITEIKPLVMHQNAAGEIMFKLVERRNAVTFRRRGASVEAAPSPVVAAAPVVEE
jgi:hypothetical protein